MNSYPHHGCHSQLQDGVGSVCCQQSLLVIDRHMFDQRIVEDRLSQQVQETGMTQIFHLVSQLCFHPETHIGNPISQDDS